MIQYIPTSGADVCERLSRALWQLSRPVASSNDVTQRMFGSLTTANGSVWLAVDTEFSIAVHTDAELGDIAEILQPWIDAGALPANANEQLADLIGVAKGHRLLVWDAFPDLFKQQSRTSAELRALGLRNEPSMP